MQYEKLKVLLHKSSVVEEKFSFPRIADAMQSRIARCIERPCFTTMMVHPSLVHIYRSMVPTDLLGVLIIVGDEREINGANEQRIMEAMDFCERCGKPRGTHPLGPTQIIACTCPRKKISRKKK